MRKKIILSKKKIIFSDIFVSYKIKHKALQQQLMICCRIKNIRKMKTNVLGAVLITKFDGKNLQKYVESVQVTYLSFGKHLDT